MSGRLRAICGKPVKAYDITKRAFGKLKALELIGSRSSNQLWVCRCECGRMHICQKSNLTGGRTTSCGCWSKSGSRSSSGLSRTPTHRTWDHMIQRCTNPNSDGYADYGGRGITVTDRWLSFDSFLSDMGRRPDGTTIDRIDNTKGYEPGNCRWATAAQQTRNTRRNRLITYNGKTMCVADWASSIGLTFMALHHRINRGWSIERALTTPNTKAS